MTAIFISMQYYIITQPEEEPNEVPIIDYISSHLLATIHIRKPDFSEYQMVSFLKQINPINHGNLVLHSHHHLYHNFNIKGIHFTGKNRNTIEMMTNYKGTKSISTHGLQEIDHLKYHFDYYFLSPIFQSTSKAGYGGNVYDLDTLKEFLHEHQSKNIVALSGIKPDKITEVRELGFYGAAILGDFWEYCRENTRKENISRYFEMLNGSIISG